MIEGENLYWKGWICSLFSLSIMPGALFAQSLLSLPHWIEQHAQPTSTSLSTTTNSIDQQTTQQKQDSLNSSFTSKKQTTDDPAKTGTTDTNVSEELTFISIARKVSIAPEQALADLEQIRNQLSTEEALILEIQIIYQLQQYEQAEVLANGFLETFPQNTFSALAHYFHTKALIQLKKTTDFSPESHNEIFVQLPSEYQADLLQVLRQKAIDQGNVLLAIQYSLQQQEVASSFYPITSEEIISLLYKVDDIKILDTIAADYSDIEFIQEELPYLRLELLVKKQQYSTALKLAQSLIHNSTAQTNQARIDYLSDLQRQINTAMQVRPRRIGVILPLSSQNRQVARLTKEILEGLRLGIKNPKNTVEEIPEKAQQPESKNTPASAKKVGELELIFRDSQLNPEITSNAVRELVEDEHVIAIIGPLIRVTSEAAASTAQQLQVPLISMSLTPTIPDMGSYIFRNNQSWEKEMKALARYAYDYKNARRFILLYPDTREGKHKMSFFWDEIIKQGGSINGSETFKSGQKNFHKQFEKLAGMDRYIPVDEKKVMEKFEEKLLPIQDFDALFIPVGKKGLHDLKVLLPYTAVYKMDHVVFLGDNGWNNYLVLLALKQHIKNPTFVDSFFKQASQAHVQHFIQLHERYFFEQLNYTGPTSYTAHAYDTVRLLSALLEQPENHNHARLQKALLDMKPFPGVTGLITFLDNGEAYRESKLLTIQGNKIIPVN
ncbi:MAG: ABC transporter substrate-binding protein [SAR324 cluster bacterium]|nr:ABC transporter substrate-binding protein [SAR324 cluster bacterium]